MDRGSSPRDLTNDAGDGPAQRATGDVRLLFNDGCVEETFEMERWQNGIAAALNPVDR